MRSDLVSGGRSSHPQAASRMIFGTSLALNQAFLDLKPCRAPTEVGAVSSIHAGAK
jgi:hypothetical protein